jgi:hypothetical protein
LERENAYLKEELRKAKADAELRYGRRTRANAVAALTLWPKRLTR